LGDKVIHEGCVAIIGGIARTWCSEDMEIAASVECGRDVTR
jgi:hypothetical protein